MKYSLFSVCRESRMMAVTVALFGVGMAQLGARPDPPAADRLMDPTKPGYQGGHLFFHTDDNTTAAPSASEEAFKDFKKGPATFAEFCKLYPLAGKPLGQDRLTLEVLATEVDATDPAAPTPAAPTPAMLSEGSLLRQSLFANSQAQTENVLPLDRQSDGSKMPEPAWEGERLFTCLEQTDTGYTLALTFAESRVITWLKSPTSMIVQPVLSQREMNKQLSISPDGQWVALDGLMTRDEASANGGPGQKLRAVLFVRLVKN
jgi:hypothetical protein